MLAVFFVVTLTLCFNGASAAPPITAHRTLAMFGAENAFLSFPPNATATSPPGSAVTKAPATECSNQCTYTELNLFNITWVQQRITATHTAATVVVIVNKRTNLTRTTTILNTEVSLGNITKPTNLNSDGTVTTAVTDYDGSTRIVAYPTTAYGDYDVTTIKWNGSLSTIVDGTPTCSIAPTGGVAVLPSHPLLPEGVQTTGVNTIDDPRGWTYVPRMNQHCGDKGPVEDLFPDLGVWNCEATTVCGEQYNFLPAMYDRTALYLTKTSTLTASDDGPTLIDAPALITPTLVAQSQTAAPAETSTPNLLPADTLTGPAPAAMFLTTAGELAPTTTTTHAVNPPAITAANALPAVQQPATETPQVLSNPQTAPSESIIITPSPVQTPTLPATPVAVQVPVTSTDSKGSITISTSTAIAHPIMASSTNAQGSIITSTSLSVGPITASVPTIITSTNAQGNVLSLTTHLPAIILTTTNAAGSEILTTSTLSVFTPLTSAPAPIVVNSETITPNSQSQYVISSQTLSPGSSITLGSGTSPTVLALQTSSGSTALVYGPSTSFLPSFGAGAAGTSPAALTIGSETIAPNAQSQYLISGSTLAPGSTITVGSGPSTTVLALQTSDGTTALVYGPRTSVLTPTPTLAPSITSPPPIIIGSETITANSQTQYIIGSQTLTPGGVVTISGTRVSLAATGQSDAILALPTTSPPAITIGSETITANSQTQYIIGSQTLTPGGVVTVSGTRVSLAAGESDIVVGSSTEALAPYITAGFGKGGNGTDGNTLQAFTGGADGMRGWGLNGKRWWKWGHVSLVVVVGVVVCL